MKQFFASILIALMAATGLVAASGSTAQAAPCGYNGCIRTNTDVSGSTAIKRGTHPRVTIRVTAASNMKAKGYMKVIFKRSNGGFFQVRNVYYNGSPKTLVGPKLNRPGKYEVIARFRAQAPFKASSDSYGLTVKRKR